MPGIRVPSGTGRYELNVKKSRFIGEASRVRSVVDARDRIRCVRSEHPQARHVAWAYVLGPDGGLPGMSDDGEPHGTAGRPILDPIVGSGLTETLVTVVRYFGGVKLGTGPLSAAYGQTSRAALDAMPQVPFEPRGHLMVETVYSLYEPLIRLVLEASGEPVEENFDSEVHLTIDLPVARFEEFERKIADLSRGSARVRREC